MNRRTWLLVVALLLYSEWHDDEVRRRVLQKAKGLLT